MSYWDFIGKDRIETERLVLRRFEKRDKEDVLKLMSEDYVCRMAGIPPFKTLEQAEQFMRDWYAEAYAVTEKGVDRVIGIVQTPINPFGRCAYMGYWLAEAYRGKGYMTEAVEAVKEVLFDTDWCEEIKVYIYLGNAASRNLALKCGFHLDYKGYSENVYNPYGRVESEEAFTITSGEYEWARRGKTFYTTAEAS